MAIIPTNPEAAVIGLSTKVRTFDGQPFGATRFRP